MSDAGYGYVVRQTYLYLRLSLVGAVLAIGLAVVYTPPSFLPDGQRVIRSISHYYYTPARIIFVGALCAAALALVTIAGKGIQSYLLDIAALLAPLIAIIPTPVKLGEVTTFDPQCEIATSECIPKGDFDYMRLGFTVWLWIAGIVILIGVIRAVVETFRSRAVDGAQPPWFLIATAGVSMAVWFFYLANGQWSQSWFHSKAHFLSAGAFFVIVAVVIVIEAIRSWLPRSTLFGAPENSDHGSIAYAAIYSLIAVGLVTDLIFAGVIIAAQSKDETVWPGGVFAVEAIGLGLFAIFFGLQTWQHRKDSEGWGKLPPSKRAIAARESERQQQ